MDAAFDPIVQLLVPPVIEVLAGAAFNYAHERGYHTWESEQQERDAHEAFEESLEEAYLQFAGRYPDLVESFFDQQFLEGRASGIVAYCLHRSGPPSARALASAHADYLNLSGPARLTHIEDLVPAAEFFLERFMEQLGHRGVFARQLDSQDIAAVALNTAEAVGQLRGLRRVVEEIRDRQVAQADAAVHPDELAREMRNANLVIRQYEATILGEHIPRPETEVLVDWVLHADPEQRLGMLFDQPGAGKSGIIRDLLVELENRQVPVLSMKADSLLGVTNADELHSRLGFSSTLEETAQYLIAQHGLTAVLVDQIDALSFILTRDQTALSTLLGVVNQLRSLQNIRIIVSCRTFDRQNDPQLSALKLDREFKISPLPEDVVARILGRIGIAPEQLLEDHRQLLRIPLHLDIYTRLFEPDFARVDAAPLGAQLEPYYTLQELYEQLWNRTIGTPTTAFPPGAADHDRPVEAIYHLVDAMLRENKDAVAYSVLDRFPASKTYLERQEIIQQDGRSVRFRHHTFLDYAYARQFVAQGNSLCEYVRNGPQGLFERSAIIQVLAYLRGFDRNEYIRQMHCLLTSEGLRYHLKDVVRGWFGTLRGILDEELQFARIHMADAGSLALVLKAMRGNVAWFDSLRVSGVLADKLRSQADEVVEATLVYLSTVIDARTTDVVQLLAPYAGRSPVWDLRILGCLLRLTNWRNDEAIEMASGAIRRGRVIGASEVRFHAMAESNPAGGCGVVRAYLDAWLEEEVRTLEAEAQDPQRQRDATLRRMFSTFSGGSLPYDLPELVLKAAREHPRILLDQIGPWFQTAVRTLTITPATADSFATDSLFSGDWAEIEGGAETEGGDGNDAEVIHELDVLPQALSIALARLAEADPEAFQHYATEYAAHDSETVQLVLARTYLANHEGNADTIADYLLADRRRFNLGVGTAQRYISQLLFAVCMQHSSQETRQALLDAVHNLQVPFELARPQWRGLAELGFLLAAPQETLTQGAIRRKQQLERRFPDYIPEKPYRPVMRPVGSPIPPVAFDRMNDVQWLEAMRTYNDATEDRIAWGSSLRGGVSQLSGAFAGQVERDPERFYNLSMQFDNSISAHYIASLLSGLGRDGAPEHLLFDAMRRFAPGLPTRYRPAVCQAIRNRANSRVRVPEDVLGILADWSQNDPDPVEQHPAEPLNAAINSNRGTALDALCACLLLPEPPDVARAFTVLETAATDPSGAVRAMAISWLWDPDIHNADYERAVGIFARAVEGYPELLGTQAAYDMVLSATWDRFEAMRPYIETMLESDNKDVREAGAILACLAALRQPDARDVAARVIISEDVQHRHGAANVYARNASDEQLWTACESGLRQLMNDVDPSVRSRVGSAFLHLRPEQIGGVRQYIRDFLRSAALSEGAGHLAKYLLTVDAFEPELVLEAINAIIEVAEAERGAGNVPIFGSALRRAISSAEVVRLPIALYMNARDDERRREAMDAFDRLLTLGSYQAQAALEEWDRR